MNVVVDWTLEPLRCETCDGSGSVDGTGEYLAQRDYFWDGVGNPSRPCRVCAGTGRHVSRARAGLAAPPRMLFDIESGGLYPHHRQAVEAFTTRGAAGLVIIDDITGPDTPEQRAKVLDWFLRPIPRLPS